MVKSRQRATKLVVLVATAMITYGGTRVIYEDKAQIQTEQIKIMSYTDIITTYNTKTLPDSTFSEIAEMPQYNISLAKEYQKLIWDICQNNNISYELVISVISNESKFNVKARHINKDGSIDKGLFQINSNSLDDYSKYAIQYGGLSKDVKFDVNNVEHNIRAGIGGLVYFRNYYKQQGVSDEDLVYYILGSYNQGFDGYISYVNRNKYISTPYGDGILFIKTKLEQEGIIL